MSADRLPDPGTPFGKAVHERLAGERQIWLTTVGRDGTPQPNPVWFLHEDGEILVYNLGSANRLVHVRQRPRVSLHFNAAADGSGIIVLTGTARIVPDEPRATENPAYVAKYAQPMANVSGDAETFANTYDKAVRIDIGKVRGF
jgi:PPOX class probable F420-dependent enzyme